MEENVSRDTRRDTRFEWKRYGLYILAVVTVLLGFLALFDIAVMPWYVGLDASVRVPDVTNRDIVEATKIIESQNLYVQVSGRYYHKTIPEGRVISQLPYPNAEVKEGRRIYLTVSKGRETLRMPSLRGQTLREARIILLRSGLELDAISYEHSDSMRANYILSQSVPPETPVSTGRKVDVVISLGPEITYVTMPDLFGLPLETAEQRLQEKGLVLGMITTQQNETFLPNTVVDQLPNAGDSVATGTLTNLTVTR